MKILNTIWFSGLKCVGIVLCVDEITREHKAYIGVGEGISEEADIRHIAEHGSPVHLPSAKRLIEHLTEKET